MPTIDPSNLPARARRDPVWFLRNVLGCEPWAAQRRIIEAVRDHPEVAVKSCHGAGKDWIAARVALWFLYSHPRSLVITTGPTARQVRGILWKEIAVAHAGARVPLGGKALTQQLTIDRDWLALGFTASEHDPDKFQGWHAEHMLVVIDEASGVSSDIYTAVDSTLSSVGSRRLEIGNPTDPASEFAKSFKTPGVCKLSITAFETPNLAAFDITESDIATGAWEDKLGDEELPVPQLVSPQWVAKRYQRWGRGSVLYKSRVQAEFPTEGKDTLIPLALIEAAQQRTIDPVKTDPIELGVDVARYGDDQTVIVLRTGPRVRVLARYTKTSTMETTGHVIRALDATGASVAKVDVVGIGAGVVDRGLETGKAFAAANAGSSSTDKERFVNARAQWFWSLRERFESGDIDIENDDDLAAELADIRWRPDSRGRIQIEAKADMKRRLGKSPDLADAVAIAFADLGEGEVEWAFV